MLISKDVAAALNLGAEVVRLAGFEPAAYGLEVRCSFQLSYRRRAIYRSIIRVERMEA